MDSRIWANPDLWRLWTWCLLKANHSDTVVRIGKGKGGYTEVEIKKDQFVFGRHSAGKKLGWHPSTIWKRLKKLEKLGYLTIYSNNICSVVTVINLEQMTSSAIKRDKCFDNNIQAIGKQGNTDKKVKKDKKEKKEKKILLTDNYKFENISEGIKKDWKEAFPAIDIENHILRAVAWLKANPKNKKKDYERFLVNWFSRAQDKAPRTTRHPDNDGLNFTMDELEELGK